MPPKVQKPVETVDAPALGVDPKGPEVEKSDVKDEPVKTSGAVPPTIMTTDGLDESATPATVMIDHPVYGKVSLADLEEIMRAEIKAETVREQADQEGESAPPCEQCFPQGWDSANAAGQDGVGCEHGSWNKVNLKAKE